MPARRTLPKPTLGRWLSRFSLMMSLITFVVMLQICILLRMNTDGQWTLRGSEVGGREGVVSGQGHSPVSRSLQSSDSDTKTRANPFDLRSCSCGLHFAVNPSEALLLPRPNVTGKKFLTIGIPTVTRGNDSYIVQTVTSLIDNLDAVQKSDVTIVVMIADVNPKVVNVTLGQLRSSFSQPIDDGLVQIIAPPQELYTNFKVTKQTYGQGLPYVEWRSKQNFDYAYLMKFAAPLSLYYMQLEDDVIVAQNYVTSIRNYIDEQKDSWTCLEFSELGFIGKLFRARDVPRLAQLLVMFFQEQPVDYTYLYFNMLMTQLQKRIRTPTLFQHQGVHSSFPGKIQPLKDRYFDNSVKRYNGDNPPAEVYTTLKTYLNYLPRLAYSRSEGYFWTHGAPVVGDSFLLVFDTPQRLERVIVDTGTEGHPSDLLQSAVLKASLTLLKNTARMECTNDIHLGSFQSGRIDVKDISSLVKFKVVCLQIVVTTEQTSWAIVREIAVFLAKPL